MSTKQDLYALLEIQKTASDDEIKKAYKKAALKHHPDRNPNNKEEANTKFQEINKAFKTLGDPEKRKRYDQHGVIDGQNDDSGGMPAGFNPFDMFQNFFGGGGMPGMNQSDTRRNSKSPDKKTTINISLSDVYKGKVIPIDFNKIICCDKCEGTGANSKENVINCTTCNGQGRVVHMVRMGPMIQQSVQQCKQCNGNGKIISPGYECIKCKGKKHIVIKRHLDCYVRPGSMSGTSISFKNESDWVPEYGEVGDLVVFINVKMDDAAFKREGDNLIMKKTITLLEALTKTEFIFKHLDDRVIKITYEDIIKPGQQMIVKGEGMPNLNDNMTHGDLIINFDILFPTSLEKDRSKYLVKILPLPKKQIWDLQLEKTPENEIIHKNMTEITDKHTTERNTYANNHQNSNHENIDDIFGDNDGGMPRMNPIECATQ
jgi:DnaJ-class molecular chaperone